MSKPRLALLAVLAGTMFAPTTSSAQNDAMLRAKSYFDDGQNLYLQGKYEAAAGKFLQAYAARPYAAFIFNIGVCYEKNKNFGKALEYYEKFLREAPNSIDKGKVSKRIEQIRLHLNPPKPPGTQPSSQPASRPTLPPIQPKGLVVIESTPEGAAIYLNHRKNGIFTRTPYTGSLPPGKHVVIIELKEFRTERKTFLVRNDRMSYLFFGLSVEKSLGWIEVKANIPGANVYIDSKDVGAVGRTPYSGNQRPGKRKIIVERVGYAPVVKEVTIVAGKTHSVDVTLEKVKYGWLKVTGRTTKEAAIKVDGKVIKCPEYPCRTKLAVGSHHVTLEREGFKEYAHDIEVEQAHEVKLAVRLEPKPSRVKAYVTYGLAAVFLTSGIIAGVMSKNRATSLQEDIDNQRMFDTGDERFTEGKVTAVIADVSFGLAIAATALATYYLFRNEGPDSYGEPTTNKLAITPTIGPSTAGVTGAITF